MRETYINKYQNPKAAERENKKTANPGRRLSAFMLNEMEFHSQKYLFIKNGHTIHIRMDEKGKKIRDLQWRRQCNECE